MNISLDIDKFLRANENEQEKEKANEISNRIGLLVLAPANEIHILAAAVAATILQHKI